MVIVSENSHWLSIRRHDIAQFLHIKNGREYEWIAKNPWFFKFAPYGPAKFDLRTLFYHEIEDALERRKQQDKLLNN
jgi:hypothetical protein